MKPLLQSVSDLPGQLREPAPNILWTPWRLWEPKVCLMLFRSSANIYTCCLSWKQITLWYTCTVIHLKKKHFGSYLLFSLKYWIGVKSLAVLSLFSQAFYQPLKLITVKWYLTISCSACYHCQHLHLSFCLNTHWFICLLFIVLDILTKPLPKPFNIWDSPSLKVLSSLLSSHFSDMLNFGQ